jgi:hypothetical protein
LKCMVGGRLQVQSPELELRSQQNQNKTKQKTPIYTLHGAFCFLTCDSCFGGIFLLLFGGHYFY